jgi:DNA-binding MarR family transcriptional regulator
LGPEYGGIIHLVNHFSGDGSAEIPTPPVDQLVEGMLALQPRLQRVLGLSLPEEVSRQLGSVTLHQLEALACLPPEGTTMRQFADAVGISGAAATALANRMIRQGLAERRDDPNDRRTVWLAPTAHALGTLQAFRGWQRRSMAGMLDRLNSDQVATLLDVLTVLARDDGEPGQKSGQVR